MSFFLWVFALVAIKLPSHQFDYYFLTHWNKAAGKQVITVNSIYSVLNVPQKAENNRDSLEHEHRLSSVICQPISYQLSGQVVPRTVSLGCHWKEHMGVCYYYY